MRRIIKQMFAAIAAAIVIFMPTLATTAFADPTLTEYPVSGAASTDYGGIVLGPDGALWYTNPNAISRMTTSGSVTTYTLPSNSDHPVSITNGPDGALWFAVDNGYNTIDHIGRITTSGTITEFPLPVAFLGPDQITTGPDGALWFTQGYNTIGRITTSGAVTDYSVWASGAPEVVGITSGSDGALWFTEYEGNKIGRITTNGVMTEYPTPQDGPNFITAGSDGALWFTYNSGTAQSISRITTSGNITSYPIPYTTGTQTGTHQIVTGPDGAIWFTEATGNKIVRMTTSGVATEYPVTTQDSYPFAITNGPDNTLWFTEEDSHKIDSITAPTPPAPNAPTNLTASSPTVHPNLSWDTVSGATSYNIYRDGTKIDSSTSNSYVDNGATDGSHSYYVTAVNANGESPPSNTVNVTVSLEYSDYPSGYFPNRVTTGSDGALWYTQSAANQIGRMTTSGTNTSYTIPTTDSFPTGITSGPDGALWFAENNKNKIGRVTTSGNFNEYSISTANAAPENLTAGSDGAIWFTENGGRKIGRITTSGAITEFSLPPTAHGDNPQVFGIASGSDGALWFTALDSPDGRFIGRITTSGNITEYPLPNIHNATNIVAGPDGALWFTLQGYSDSGTSDMVGRITISGSITELYPQSHVGLEENPITVGPDGKLWFIDNAKNNIDSITTSGVVTTNQIPIDADFYPSITSGPDNALWFTENNGNKLGRYDVPVTSPAAPSNLSAASPAQNPSLSWDSVSGAVSYNIYRNNSLVDTISPNNTSYTDYLTSEGNNSYFVTAVNSGGESAHSNTVNVLVDRTNPTITSAVTYITDTNGKNTGNVKVTFTCNDNTGGSGLASCASPVTVDNEGIGHTVDGTATDNAGNSTTIHVNASQLVTAINAGGNNSGNYVTDTDVSGGTQYTSNNSVDTSNVTIQAAPQDVYQSTRYGNMTYTIPNLTPNANYTLRLHFNEVYWGAIAGSGGDGSRVFNVAVNGQTALSNFDIFKEAGGANIAIVRELPVTADSNGNVTLDFSNVTDNALVSGLELYKGDLPAEPSVPTASSALINAGGDTQGSFAADAHFSGGTTYTTNASVDTSGVTNPAPDSVYQSTRYGNFTYTIPHMAPNTNVNVRLHFNEVYWGTSLANNQGGDGSRLFNVSINGSQVLNNFDIYQTAGGANKAITENFDTTTDSYGRVTVQFTTVNDNALVSGIEITQ